MSGVVLPPCWLIGLKRPSSGVYRLYGRVNGNLQENWQQEAPSKTIAASAPVPAISHCLPTLQRRASKTSRLVKFSLLWSHCSFPLVLVSTRLCLCPPRMEYLFPSVLWKVYNQTLMVFKVILPGDSQSLCWISRLGSLMWGSESLQHWETFFGIIVFQFVSHPPVGMGFGFTVNVPLLLSCCGFFFVFGLGVSLFWGERKWAPVSSCRWLLNN